MGQDSYEKGAGGGGLILMLRSYFNNYDDVDDCYDTYLPIESKEEAQQLNEQVCAYDLQMCWRWKMVALKNGQLPQPFSTLRRFLSARSNTHKKQNSQQYSCHRRAYT